MAKVFNPYIAGNPIRKESDFFGRKEIIEKVEQELGNPSVNSIVLSGQRRIGKTSLLLQLENRLPQDDFLGIYFDLQDQAQKPLGEVLTYLADAIATKAGIYPLNIKFDDTGKNFTETFLPRLYDSLGDRRPVILLDEFDVIDQVDSSELPKIPAAKGLFPFLRNLMSIDSRLAFVFVIGRRVDDLHINTISLFKTAILMDVWLLDHASALKLILKASDNGTLIFDDRAVEKIFFLTNGHPYLTQLLCQRIWNSVCLNNEANYPVLVNKEMTDAVIQDTINSGDAALRWIWDGLSPAEKIFAAALAELSKDGIEISDDDISQVLAANAMRLQTREIEIAPKDLVKRKILEPGKDSKYKFAVELFRVWVEKNHSIKDVKDELDRVEPEADGLYHLGLQCFKRRQYPAALEYFQKALDINSNHFRARLGLGEVMFEQGDLDKAVATLRLAYTLDAEEAKYPYVRALLAQARVREDSGYLPGVVDSCESVLKIVPNQDAALAMKARAKRLLDFAQRMDVIIKRSDEIVEERTPLLISLLSDQLAKQIMNYAVKPSLYDWRDKKLKTLNEAKSQIKNLGADWLATPDAQNIITSIVAPWLSGISQEILLLMRAVYKDFELYFDDIALSGSSKLDFDQNLGVESLQIDFNNTIGIITGTIVSVLVGGGVLALLFTPPLGDEIIAGVFMVIFYAVGLGSWISEKIKEVSEKWALEKDIPGYLRKSFLPDQKIQQILYVGEIKMREEIETYLSRTFINDAKKQLSGNIRRFLDSQREKIKGIIG